MGLLQPVEWPMQSRGVVEAGHVARLAPGRNAVVELLLKVLKNCPGTAPPPTSAVPPLPGVVGFCVDGKDPTCTSWSGGSDTTASCNQHTSTMSNGPSWGTPEWSARQEFELIRQLAAGDEQTRQLWLQKQRVTATVQQLAATAAAAAAARAAAAAAVRGGSSLSSCRSSSHHCRKVSVSHGSTFHQSSREPSTRHHSSHRRTSRPWSKCRWCPAALCALRSRVLHP